MTIYRERGGVFAPITTLSINDNGTFKTIAEAWINDNGTFKKVFSSERQYSDPSAYYDMVNASGGTITRAEPVFEDAYNFRGWKLAECRIPFSGTTNDVDWSLCEVIVISSGDALICDALSTGGNQPSCKSIEYSGGNTVNLGSYVSTNTNFAVSVRSGFIGQMAYYNYLKLTLHPAEFSDKYNQQLGVRWRWHSKLHDMYFEHIFTNASMIITPV
ncbi:hypothetical protein MFFDBJGM_02462 [Pectobacterium versatile]|uniref:hypothetical protein n=1 Tax=Pectobacterium versatile TaxID=2488639 RepID=UPI000DAB3726|nr:hypothetical protein [Pectobacterium versatile]GBO49444.1 hypothetical protein MFFDBJGM_02462 [Pectobacterium versatile]GKX39587.1 hypothetical protein SOASR014_33260 [Pectobacterium carotovorum subsp. carotovorum]GLX45683.1 hypothetical protein Pcaca01_33510 [Pectobacterium carotovorum subsp. carotovorum]